MHGNARNTKIFAIIYLLINERFYFLINYQIYIYSLIVLLPLIIDH